MADVSARALRPSSAPVHGTLFFPTAAEPLSAVLVIGGSGGSEPSYVGQALATEGIAALSVAYFGRDGLPAQLPACRRAPRPGCSTASRCPPLTTPARIAKRRARSSRLS